MFGGAVRVCRRGGGWAGVGVVGDEAAYFDDVNRPHADGPKRPHRPRWVRSRGLCRQRRRLVVACRFGRGPIAWRGCTDQPVRRLGFTVPQRPGQVGRGCCPSQSARGAQCHAQLDWWGRPGMSIRPLAHSRVPQGSSPGWCQGNRRARTRLARSGSGTSRNPSPRAASSVWTSSSSQAMAAKPEGSAAP